ncbi:MAG: AAA family ATPase [Propioniciclava sp.]
MRAIIGMADQNLRSDLESLVGEFHDIDVVAIATDTTHVISHTDRYEPDLIFIHEGMGPEPTVSVIRDLALRRPATAVIQVSPERSPATVVRALEAGARAVVAYPFVYEDFSARVQEAMDRAQHLKTILSGAASDLQASRGRVLAVVGAKGGVGVTTMATHLALDQVNHQPAGRVCVVDLDIEKGDVNALLDVRQSVSVADLARVYQDLSNTTVSDAVVQHESGVHLLLAPTDVRQSEFVTPEALRAIVALLRREFDLVILDAGGYVSPTQASAVELADATVVVTTADVLAVRALRKRILAWEALGVHHESELFVLINQVDRSSLFPPDAVEKLTTATVLETQIPLSRRVLEDAINERDPQAVTDVNWWKLLTRVRQELSIDSVGGRRLATSSPTPPPTPATPSKVRARRAVSAGRERGAIALETVGVLPMVLALAVLMWQVAVVGLGAVWLGQAATEATRTYAITGSTTEAQAVARETIPATFSDGLTVSATGTTVQVQLTLPTGTLIPRLGSYHDVIQEPG